VVERGVRHGYDTIPINPIYTHAGRPTGKPSLTGHGNEEVYILRIRYYYNNKSEHSHRFQTVLHEQLPINMADIDHQNTTEDMVVPAATNSNSTVQTTHRYIYNDTDLQHFLQSPTKDALYKFTTAMGKSCATSTATSTSLSSSSSSYQYNPQQPLIGLSPGIACLHGALHVMKEWVHNDFPPTPMNTIGNRFGNPMFRKWHTQLMQRSKSIIMTILNISNQYAVTTNNVGGEDYSFDMEILVNAHEAGMKAARDTDNVDCTLDNHLTEQDQTVVSELALYLQDSFGQPIRLDYGTGHETSFHIFLFLLCQLHIFDNYGYKFHTADDDGNIATTNTDTTATTTDSKEINRIQQQQQQQQLPSIVRCKAIIISTYHQYLQVTREVQTQYMLEPAGSHGVWGLDDYHCLPFYFGACQLVEQQQHASSSTSSSIVKECLTPSSIHDDHVLQEYGDTYLYFSCIRYIKFLKKNVPFFESSPMLDDISHIATWLKISTGLLKLYDGEVLSKRQVVQHLVFGTLFPANWVPSQTEEANVPPTETFRPTTQIRKTATPGSDRHLEMTEMTRAPWAK
jgi:serine/threonine-protein phosphatase 2A activator